MECCRVLPVVNINCGGHDKGLIIGRLRVAFDVCLNAVTCLGVYSMVYIYLWYLWPVHPTVHPTPTKLVGGYVIGVKSDP